MSDSLTPSWRLRALLAALWLPPLLYLVPFSTLTGWIGQRPASRGAARPDDRALAEWVDRILGKLPGPWKRTCLKRSIVLFYLLRRAGAVAQLRIGVRRDQRRRLAAHAWLVRDGEPYLEEGADHVGAYQVLSEFP